MKYIALFVFACLIISINAQTDSDWKKLSADYCKGVNKLTKGLSDEVIRAVVFSGETGTDLVELFKDEIALNPDRFMKDAQILDGLEKGMSGLSDKLAKKHENIFSSVDESEINNHYLINLESQDDCQFSRALIKIGMREQAMESVE